MSLANPRVRRAREFRVHLADAERALWRTLRGRRFAGYKFRRQEPIGPFFVDFVCFEHRLVIEVDGAQHLARAAYDRAREIWLVRGGLRVIRFTDREVLTQIDGVQLAILAELADHPSPQPSPARGEGAPSELEAEAWR